MEQEQSFSPQLDRDVRLALLLGRYMDYWGIPSARQAFVRGEKERVEVYSFPAKSLEDAHRFASVGVSSLQRYDGTALNEELMTVLPPGLRGANEELVTGLLMELVAYSRMNNVSYRWGMTLVQGIRIPSCWSTTALLLDEPRFDPEELSFFQHGEQSIRMMCVYFIHQDEVEFIGQHGAATFFERMKRSEWNLADPIRPSCLAPAT